jgi:hypothetical protein
MALMTAADVYGSASQGIVGVKDSPSASAASGTIGNVTGKSNSSFSWVAFVLLLVLIRVFNEVIPSV